MAITYKRDETFTGKRKSTIPDPESESGTKEIESDVIDIIVTFTDGTITHTRNVNVCFEADGTTYDEAATKERIEQVMLGVQNKMALGLLQ